LEGNEWVTDSKTGRETIVSHEERMFEDIFLVRADNLRLFSLVFDTMIRSIQHMDRLCVTSII
jgi:hypothetical protein